MKRKLPFFRMILLLLGGLFSGCTSSIDYQARISGTNEFVVEIEHAAGSSQIYEYSTDPEGGLTLVNEEASTIRSLIAQLTGRSAKNTYTFRAAADGKTRLTFIKYHPNTPDLTYTVANFDIYVEGGKITKFNEVIVMGSE